MRIHKSSKSYATGRKPIDLFGKHIPPETQMKMYQKHLDKNKSGKAHPIPVIFGTDPEVNAFEQMYFVPYPQPDSCDEIGYLMIFQFQEEVYLYSRHMIRGERIHRYTSYIMERHKRNKLPSKALNCLLVGHNHEYYVLILGLEKYFVRDRKSVV